MAEQFPTLSVEMMTDSTIKRTPRILTHEFGDGYTARIPDGINNMPAEFTIVYRDLSIADHNILMNFIKPLAASGATVDIPLYPEDPTGSARGLFYIVDYTPTPSEGGVLWSWTINAKEVFF